MAVVKKAKGHKKEKKRKVVDDDDRVELPTELSEPVDDIGAYTWLIFGEKKIGKTSLTALMGKALHMFTEPGGKALRLYPITIDSWKRFKKAVKAFVKSDYDTAVIDIADKLYPMCEDYTCEKLVISDLSEEDWGKGWRENRKEFERVMDMLLNSGKGVVFISHAQEQEVETRDGSKYDRVMPTMHKRMRDLVEGVVDVWAYYTYNGKRRVLQILGDDHISAGHRLEGRFQTPNGRPLRFIGMGSSAKQGYTNLVAAFNNEYEPERSGYVDEKEDTPKKSKKFKLRKH